MMPSYQERNALTLLTGATDPQGDPITLRRINGTVVSAWPHVLALPKGTLSITQTGAVTYNDGGTPTGHPLAGASAQNGTFSFTLWDGVAESPAYVATVNLVGRAPQVSGAVFRGQHDPADAPGPRGTESSFLSPWGFELAPTGGGVWRWVDPTAPAGGTGSQAAPFSTINAALSAAQAGDTILLRGGEYRERVAINTSSAPTQNGWNRGTQADPVRIVRYGAERPVITGADPLTGWTQCTSQADAKGNPNWASLWKATLASHPYGANAGLILNLHQGSQPMYLNVFAPGFGSDTSKMFFYDDVTKYFNSTNSTFVQGASTLTLTSAAAFGGFANASDLVGYWICWRRLAGNSSAKARITAFDPATDTVTLNVTGYNTNSPGFCIYGHPGLINAAGQFGFYEEPGGGWTVYCWPWSAAQMGQISYTVRESGFVISNASDVLLYGIDVRQTRLNGINHPYGTSQAVSRFKIEECSIRNVASEDVTQGAGAEFNLGSDNEFLNCTIIQCQGKASRFGGQTGSRMANCLIDSCLSTAAQWQKSQQCLFTYNSVANVKGVHGNGMSIYLGCRDILVHGNIIRTEIGNALVYQESASIYLLFNDVQCPADTAAQGIYNNNNNPREGITNTADDPGGDLVAINNTAGPHPVRTNSSAVKQGVANYMVGKTAGSGHYAANNVAYGGLDPGDVTQPVALFLNNCLCGRNSIQNGNEPAWLSGGNFYQWNLNLLFRDYNQADYRPVAGGPLDAAGVNVTSGTLAAPAGGLLPSGAWLRGHDVNRDCAGRAVNWSAPPIGAYLP